MWRTLVSRLDQKRVRQLLESTALAALGSNKVTRFQVADANRLDLPMHIELEVADSSLASTNENGAEVTNSLSQVVADLPEWMRKPEATSLGSLDLDVGPATVMEWQFVVMAPPSLALEALPPDRVVLLGPLRLGTQFTREPQGGVRVRLRLPIDKTRFSPSDLEAIRSACKALAAADPISLELRRAADAELARVPEDAAALRALSRADQIERRWDAFDRDLRRLVASGRATPADYNDHAWAALFRKGADEHALDDARRAVEMSNRRASGILHTLAAIEAGVGRNGEAYATLIESIDAGDGKPIPSDYYVLGRTAENLGLVDVAVAEYRKVVRTNPARPSPFDTAELAEARLRALGK
jgi:tetratricopeptide (TPR) repeat protein